MPPIAGPACVPLPGVSAVHVRESLPTALLTRIERPDEWRGLPWDLRRKHVRDITRTSTLPLADWTMSAKTRPGDIEVPWLVATGACLDDVARWNVARHGGRALPRDTAPLLALEVSHLRKNFPGMALRDAVGWVLLGSPHWDSHRVHTLGHIPQGWLYVAAGFSDAEALAARRTGSFDEDALRVLAALRGEHFLPA
jgi:hypothetical protein